mgnify:CR=1 FL=1
MANTIYSPAEAPKPNMWAKISPPWKLIASIFALIAMWQIGILLVYGSVVTPSVDGSERAKVLAIKMLMRVGLFMTLFICVRLVQFALSSGEGHLAPKLMDKLRSDPARVLRGVMMFTLGAISFVWLQSTFMSSKVLIPEIHPFSLDPALAKIDRILFFGHDPYTAFQWLFDVPNILKRIDQAYTYWAGLVAGFWIYCFLSERMERTRRFQYLFASVLLWFIAGTFAATLLSSAGPCYYGEFTGDTAAFAPLMQQLHSFHDVHYLDAVNTQGILLEMYHTPHLRFGGISAAPSLHVGTSLMLLILFRKTPIARELLILFNIAIYIGSIILGWHYAVDGLIVVPIVLFCWWAGGKLGARVRAWR